MQLHVVQQYVEGITVRVRGEGRTAIRSYRFRQKEQVDDDEHTHERGRMQDPSCRSERSAERKWIYLACILDFLGQLHLNSIPWPVSSGPGANDRASVTRILPPEWEIIG